jgi:hypothetical protein
MPASELRQYPTALELTGLGLAAAADEALEGLSLGPLLLLNSSSSNDLPGLWQTKAAFSQYPRVMNSTMAKHAPFLPTSDSAIGHTANELTHMVSQF